MLVLVRAHKRARAAWKRVHTRTLIHTVQNVGEHMPALVLLILILILLHFCNLAIHDVCMHMTARILVYLLYKLRTHANTYITRYTTSYILHVSQMTDIYSETTPHHTSHRKY